MRRRRMLVAGLTTAVLAGAGGLGWHRAATGPAPPTRAAAAAASPASARRLAYYRSPMDPRVHSDRPARDEMGMEFVAVYEDELLASAVAGRAVLPLTPEHRRMLGVRTVPVIRQPLARTIRTVGRVTADERRLHHVHTKYEGYVEQLYVDFTGKFVRRGQPLLSLYSPELLASEEEYLVARKAQKQLAESGLPAVAQGGFDLLEAARQRLRLFDVPAGELSRLEETGEVRRTVDLSSPVTGYVVQRTAYHGMRVTPADSLFDIVDLSHLWVLADVYEHDLPSVRVGMMAQVVLSYLPDRSWRGPVTFVAPVVDEATRTVKVRVEVDNPGQDLKPEMFADVVLESGWGSGLVVPESAVVHAGERTLVFVERADGALDPREVRLGPRVAAGVQVVSGLLEGEPVVTSANFLLDSESSLKAAVTALGTGPPRPLRRDP